MQAPVPADAERRDHKFGAGGRQNRHVVPFAIPPVDFGEYMVYPYRTYLHRKAIK